MNNVLTSLLRPIPKDFQSDYARLKQKLNDIEPSKNPYLIHMCGIPGAGKTTIAKPLYDMHLRHDGFYYLDFDHVMNTLDSYNQLSVINPQKAFHLYAPIAANIGYHLLKDAIENNISIIFDHGASPQSHIELLKNLEPYKTRIIYVACDLSVAKKRVKNREHIIKRYTSEAMIIDRNQKINAQIDLYKDAVDVFINWTSDQSSHEDIEKLYERLAL